MTTRAVPPALARRLPRTVHESLALRRLARRAGLRSWRQLAHRQPMEQPVGVKLELTHRCNLRCGFCYTDSPRRTQQGTFDMPDEDWRRVVEEAIELGAIEAVVSGGEPLLRRELALSLVERMSHAGMGVSLNTNGWFLDEQIADRLARLRGLTVHLSIDGASPQVHDASRGRPGSWRRAIRGLDLLLARDIRVQVNHLLTPMSAPTVGEFLDQMWVLGVRLLGWSAVIPIGAAARSSGWEVAPRTMRRAIAELHARRGTDMKVIDQPAVVEGLATRDDRPPAALLVRPNGSVALDSMHPFTFGHVSDGLDSCWNNIRTRWRDAAVTQWARGIDRTSNMPARHPVPYRDDDVAIVGAPGPTARPRPRPTRLLEPGSPVVPTDLDSARAEVVELALARAYSPGDVRLVGSSEGDRYLRVHDTASTLRMNATAALVMDACSDARLGDAVDALERRHASVARVRLTRDAIGAVRWLTGQGVLRPAPAAAD